MEGFFAVRSRLLRHDPMLLKVLRDLSFLYTAFSQRAQQACLQLQQASLRETQAWGSIHESVLLLPRAAKPPLQLCIAAALRLALPPTHLRYDRHLHPCRLVIHRESPLVAVAVAEAVAATAATLIQGPPSHLRLAVPRHDG